MLVGNDHVSGEGIGRSKLRVQPHEPTPAESAGEVGGTSWRLGKYGYTRTDLAPPDAVTNPLERAGKSC